MNHSKLKSIGIVSLGTLIGVGLGIISQAIIAAYFGAGKATDSYFMAHSIAGFFVKMLILGQLSSIFLPIFLEHYTKDKNSAWKLSSNLLNVGIFVSAIVTIFCLIFSSGIVNFFAPGFEYSTKRETILLFKLILPAGLLMALSTATLANILNALKKFILPVIIQLFLKMMTIVLLLIFGNRFGIIILAGIVLVESLIGFMILYVTNLKIGLKYYPVLSFTDVSFRKLVKLWFPFIYNNTFALGAQVVYKIMVSGLPVGSLSALSYSERIFTVLSQVTNDAVNLVSRQEFAQNTAKKFYSLLGNALKNSIRILGLISIPISIFLIISAQLIVRVLFGRGEFLNQGGVLSTSMALFFWSILLFPFGCYQLFASTGFALKDTKFIVRLSILTEVIRASLYYILPRFFSFSGLILSGIVAYIIAIIFYQYRLKSYWKIENVKGIYVNLFFLKMFMIIVLLVIINLTGKFLLDTIFPQEDLFILASKLAFLGIVWFGLYFIFSLKVFRIEEAKLLWDFVKTRGIFSLLKGKFSTGG